MDKVSKLLFLRLSTGSRVRLGILHSHASHTCCFFQTVRSLASY